MNKQVCTIRVNNKRIFLDNTQELNNFDKEYFQNYNMGDVVETILKINNNDKAFYITEYSDNWLSIATKKRTYSVGYTEGLDCITIYEELEEGGEPSRMRFVNYIAGDIKDIITDSYAIDMLENFIFEYEEKLNSNSNHEMLKCNLTDLSKFKNHISNSINEMLDNDDYDNEKYSLNITLNGKTINLGNNADIFNDLITLVDNEVEELKTSLRQNLDNSDNEHGYDEFYISDNEEIMEIIYNYKLMDEFIPIHEISSVVFEIDFEKKIAIGIIYANETEIKDFVDFCQAHKFLNDYQYIK